MTTLSTSPVTVLVVDDQTPFRAAVAAVVSRADGFRMVGEAASGEEAVSAAGQLHPDLVLMDIVMPGLDGVQATPRVLEASPSSVVVLVSTYEEADLPAGAATCGRRAYLHKADLTTAALRKLWDGRANGAGTVNSDGAANGTGLPVPGVMEALPVPPSSA